ncbi:hypothetical protein GIB67_041808 [Kingdonia uniflora]|uniref:Uncharacterized protein n=1 Tax=Kingdonia uniflora TaxID=39325 RepID=A0A7J7L5L0_9MAGN|nr:hypothetical protein GIB67_041808 [Kingdonia uniflora]
MVKTRSQKVLEARVLNDLRLAFKIDEIREVVFGQQGYDAVWFCSRPGRTTKEFVLMMAMEEIMNEDMNIAAGRLKACGVPRHCTTKKGEDYLYLLPDLAREKKCRRLRDEVSLEYVQGVVKDSRTDGFCYYLAQFDYGLTVPLSNLAKGIMNLIGACPTQLNCNFWEVILVCENLNGRWVISGSGSRISVMDILEYYAMKYVTATDDAYLSSSSLQPPFFDLSSAGYKVARKESFIDFVAREGSELELVLKDLGINRYKRVASRNDKVKRSQAQRKMVGKAPNAIKENVSISKYNTPLKFAQPNDMPDAAVEMATILSKEVQKLTMRKIVMMGSVLEVG